MQRSMESLSPVFRMGGVVTVVAQRTRKSPVLRAPPGVLNVQLGKKRVKLGLWSRLLPDVQWVETEVQRARGGGGAGGGGGGVGVGRGGGGGGGRCGVGGSVWGWCRSLAVSEVERSCG